MGNRNDTYNKKSQVGMLKYNVTNLSDNPFYFSRGANKFFGSKVEDVYANKDNTKFIFREKLTNSPDGRTKYKLGFYDYNNKKFETSDIYDDKFARDFEFRQVKEGTLDFDEITNK